jgi:hypothetical protein
MASKARARIALLAMNFAPLVPYLFLGLVFGLSVGLLLLALWKILG